MSTRVDQPHLIDVVEPGAGRRRVPPFTGNTVAASLCAIAAVTAAGVTWWMLWYFDRSLHVEGGQAVAARVIEIVLAVLVVAVPWYGVLALGASLKGRRLAAQQQFHDARMAIEDSKDRILVVVGIGLTALIVAFVAFLLAGNHGSVRKVMLDW